MSQANASITMQRQKNWTLDEQLELIRAVGERKCQIMGKFSATVTTQTKRRAWDEIYRAMGCLRTPDQLQQCWRNLLKKTRQLYSLFKKHEQRTGAGPNPHVLTPLVEAVLEVIGEDSPNLCGLEATIGDTEE
ncbi:unnamed protein product [Ixodes hexagonus]